MVANLLQGNTDRQLLRENFNKQKLRRIILILQALLSTGVYFVAKFSAIQNDKETSLVLKTASVLPLLSKAFTIMYREVWLAH